MRILLKGSTEVFHTALDSGEAIDTLIKREHVRGQPHHSEADTRYRALLGSLGQGRRVNFHTRIPCKPPTSAPRPCSSTCAHSRRIIMGTLPSNAA